MLGREPGAEDEIAALEELVDLDGTEDGEPERSAPAAVDPDEDGPDPDAVPAGPIGELGVLADLGMSEKELLTLQTDALSEIAEAVGAAEVLESVR